MTLSPLGALSPLDGRYAARCVELREVFSEAGLISRARPRRGCLAAGAGRRSQHRRAATASSREARALRRASRTIHRGRCCRGQGDRARDQPRRQGGRVPASSDASPTMPTGAGARVRALRVHVARTSTTSSYAMMLREARDRVLLPRLDALIATLRAMAHAHADAADAGAHARPDRRRRPRSARKWRCSSRACAAPARHASRECRSAARSTARSATSTRTSPRIRASTGRRSRGDSSNRSASTGMPTRRRSSRTTGWRNMSTRSRAATAMLIDLCRDFWGYISLGLFPADGCRLRRSRREQPRAQRDRAALRGRERRPSRPSRGGGREGGERPRRKGQAPGAARVGVAGERGPRDATRPSEATGRGPLDG